MNTNIVSIIIPVYNGEGYIKKCVNTLKNQSYKNWEAIFINDGSKDNTLNILKELADNDKRIKIINQNNKGAAVARINGVNAAKGDYITFLDVDDELNKAFLEEMIKEITINDSDICICSYNIIENNSSKINIRKCIGSFNKIDFLKKILCLKCGWELWGKIYKSELFKNNIKIPENIRIGEDAAIFVQLVVNSNRISIINKPLYNYIQFDSSASHIKSRDYALETLKAAYFIDCILKNEYYYDELKEYIDCMFLLFYSNSTRKAYIENTNEFLNSIFNEHLTVNALLKIEIKKSIYIFMSYLSRKILNKPLLK